MTVKSKKLGTTIFLERSYPEQKTGEFDDVPVSLSPFDEKEDELYENRR